MSWVPHRRSDRGSSQVTAAVWAISDCWTFCCEGRDEWPLIGWSGRVPTGKQSWTGAAFEGVRPCPSSSAPSSSPGPEWIAAVGAKTAYITLRRSWENGFIESFNAGLRDELLDGDLLFAHASEDRDRELPMALQHTAPATGLWATNRRRRKPSCPQFRCGQCATPTTSTARAGSEADNALTLKLAPSSGPITSSRGVLYAFLILGQGYCKRGGLCG